MTEFILTVGVQILLVWAMKKEAAELCCDWIQVHIGMHSEGAAFIK